MRNVSTIEFHAGSKEERLPGFLPDFPYIASYVDLDQCPGHLCPWHWHKSVEIFYIKSGCLRYSTPGGRWEFPAGSGGMVNANVLHMTSSVNASEKGILAKLLYIACKYFIYKEAGHFAGPAFPHL
ncbi:MAG: AraC family ligand binding domain-containing protein [Eubacteriales bacterium]|nr:AraC family ligand binding domain-containing protein [Eubacteriales bacterium]